MRTPSASVMQEAFALAALAATPCAKQASFGPRTIPGTYQFNTGKTSLRLRPYGTDKGLRPGQRVLVKLLSQTLAKFLCGSERLRMADKRCQQFDIEPKQ